MGMEEKKREEAYWQSFAETGKFPALPNDILADKGPAYLLSILKGQYNSLTKVLFAEVLGRTSGFSDEISLAQTEAAQWIRPMIFAKKRMYERRKEMAASFAEFMSLSQNPVMHRMLEEIDYEQQLRDWPTKAKALYSPHDPLDANRIFTLVKELSSKPESYDTVRNDEILRNLVLFWIATFIAKLRKQGNGIGKDLGAEFLKVLRVDGLENLPVACWDRKKMEVKPAKGRDYFPATAEKLASGMYALVIERYGRQVSLTEEDNKVIEWAFEVLMRTYERLDDEWASFRKGKILLLLGKTKEAKELVMPSIRKNATKFWAWDMLGHLFPEHRRACLAKSLLCHEEDPKMMNRVRKEAIAIGLPVDDVDALKELSVPASDLLFEGMPCIKGVYDSSFLNKEGKIRVRFILENGANTKPVSPAAVKLPRGLPLGAPINAYVDPLDANRILLVRLRESSLWDILPVVSMTYYGKSQKGRAMLTFSTANITCSFEDFPILRKVAVGDVVAVRYATRECEYGTAYDVKSVELTTEKSTAVFAFRGGIRLSNGANAPGFVDGVYVPKSLVFSLADQNLSEGTPVKGRAIRLAPTMERDRFGVMRKKAKSNAITLELLSGEELEKYKLEVSG